eukprot:5276774-Amphidinium_carterae.2
MCLYCSQAPLLEGKLEAAAAEDAAAASLPSFPPVTAAATAVPAAAAADAAPAASAPPGSCSGSNNESKDGNKKSSNPKNIDRYVGEPAILWEAKDLQSRTTTDLQSKTSNLNVLLEPNCPTTLLTIRTTRTHPLIAWSKLSAVKTIVGLELCCSAHQQEPIIQTCRKHRNCVYTFGFVDNVHSDVTHSQPTAVGARCLFPLPSLGQELPLSDHHKNSKITFATFSRRYST